MQCADFGQLPGLGEDTFFDRVVDDGRQGFSDDKFDIFEEFIANAIMTRGRGGTQR